MRATAICARLIVALLSVGFPAAAFGEEVQHQAGQPGPDTSIVASAAGSAEHHGESTEGIPTELPDLLEYLKCVLESQTGPVHAVIEFLFAWRGPFCALVILILVTTVLLRGAARKAMIPGRFQTAVEAIVGTLADFIRGILGRQAEEFIPFLGTLFLYIWVMNLSGLIPLFKGPTSLFETTLGLAIVVFLYVQTTGLRKLGVLGYLHHIAGSPTDAVGWALVPLMLPLHVISELAKPASLALRLFGNIMGEDVLIAVFTGLGVVTLAAFGSPVGIPWEFPFIFLGLLLSTVQALVFTLLSTIYISQVLPHEEEHQ